MDASGRQFRDAVCLPFCFVGAMVFLMPAASTLSAGELRFHRHEISAESQFPAAAAIDVNQDGKLDIVSGGWWYAAPDWTRHFVREVEFIRGRYDDYSNLPLDVNGDGLTDLISVNYRSRAIYWIENPGPNGDAWNTHLVERPGPSETGRLFDVDGDGRLDILPNDRDFVAWWELIPGDKTASEPNVSWKRHDLPIEAKGHGIGFGDVDGDGRGDIVSPNGWLHAPEDQRNGAWRWNRDFQLHRDAGIPILVFDVDGDGDNDLVWGRGHRTGLYWLEQVIERNDADGDMPGRTWELHAIDTSFSQMHSLLLGDLDRDGRPEVVVGKRSMGHDGKDPGEWDPLVIAAYSFEPRTRAWKRTVISAGGGAAFGTDPRLADLDADGDLDIIAPDRSGLYYFENLTVGDAENGAAGDDEESDAVLPELAARAEENHADLMTWVDPQGDKHPVTNEADWALRRAHILAGMQQAMGPLPDSSRRVPLDVQVTTTDDTAKYIRQSISFAAEPGDRVPAYLLIPKGIRRSAPAMLCLHQTTKIGKDEPAGLGGRETLHYAHELAERGYVCIVPDYPSFGDYPYDFVAGRASYLSGSMKAIWNNIRAVDVLETLPEVDRDRIGVIGHSLGGHNSLFTAAFDQRLRAVVSSCGFTAFHHYYGGKLAGWTSERYMPRFRDEYGNDPDRVPFDFHEVVGALAPRPFFTNSPLHDSNFDVEGVRKTIAEAEKVYKLLGAPESALRADYPDSEHDFPDEIREAAYEWLEEQLKQVAR